MDKYHYGLCMRFFLIKVPINLFSLPSIIKICQGVANTMIKKKRKTTLETWMGIYLWDYN